jgi:hypothetical protein
MTARSCAGDSPACIAQRSVVTACWTGLANGMSLPKTIRPGGTSAKSARMSAGFHHAVSKKRFGTVVQAARQPAEVGDGRVGEDDARAGRVDRAGQRRAPEAVDPRPAVHEDGQAAPAGQREDVVQPGVVEREALAARVELEAHGPGVERGLGAAQRLVVRVQARERVQPPARVAGGGGERLVGLGVAAALAERDQPAARAGALQGVLGVLERGEQARRVAQADVDVGVDEGEAGTPAGAGRRARERAGDRRTRRFGAYPGALVSDRGRRGSRA